MIYNWLDLMDVEALVDLTGLVGRMDLTGVAGLGDLTGVAGLVNLTDLTGLAGLVGQMDAAGLGDRFPHIVEDVLIVQVVLILDGLNPDGLILHVLIPGVLIQDGRA